MSTKNKTLAAIIAVAALMLAGVPAGAATEGDPYSLATCAVSGKALG